jgi:hypothetical protein
MYQELIFMKLLTIQGIITTNRPEGPLNLIVPIKIANFTASHGIIKGVFVEYEKR